MEDEVARGEGERSDMVWTRRVHVFARIKGQLGGPDVSRKTSSSTVFRWGFLILPRHCTGLLREVEGHFPAEDSRKAKL